MTRSKSPNVARTRAPAWKFEIGTQLSLAFVCRWGDEAGDRCRFTAEALVVWCEPVEGSARHLASGDGSPEVPEELKRSLEGLGVKVA